MIKMATQYWAFHSPYIHSAAGRCGPWLAQWWIRPGQPMLAGVLRRARRGHYACEAQGGAPTNSSLAVRVWCAEPFEHRQRVAYPPGKATRRGALWGGGSMRGSRNLTVAVVFVEKSDEEVD
jgi:hypothetical protein